MKFFVVCIPFLGKFVVPNKKFFHYKEDCGMQEETPAILRRNIKYNGLIQSAILICFMILLGIPMQLNEGVDVDTKAEIIDLSAGVTNTTIQRSKELLPKELSVGVSNAMLQVLNEPQVEILEVYTVTAAEIETESETTEVAEAETVEVEESKPETVYKSLEEVKISRNMDLTETTGLSREDFCELLANFKYDYAGFYERNSGLIWDLSQKYQVNEIFICGVFALESYFGADDKHISTHNYGSIMNKKGKMVGYASDSEGRIHLYRTHYRAQRERRKNRRIYFRDPEPV